LIRKHADFPQLGKSARIQSSLSSPLGEEPCPLILANGFLNHPESFIKIADAVFKKNNDLFYHRHFLPSGRADLTASALLQRIRCEGPQLHPLRLLSAATSTRE